VTGIPDSAVPRTPAPGALTLLTPAAQAAATLPEGFSEEVVWSGLVNPVNLEFAGTYTFTVTADDGVRVYLDGTLVIDQWKDQPPTTYTASRSVSAGDHVLSVEYYEHTEVAVARLAISP
jgi:PA14 domain